MSWLVIYRSGISWLQIVRWQTGQGNNAKLWDKCAKADTMVNVQGQIHGQFGELWMGKSIVND